MLRASWRNRMPVNFALTVSEYQRQAKLTVCQTQRASSFPARRPFVFLAYCFLKSQSAVALRSNNNGLLDRLPASLRRTELRKSEQRKSVTEEIKSHQWRKNRLRKKVRFTPGVLPDDLTVAFDQ
jgi:hypothetical protein